MGAMGISNLAWMLLTAVIFSFSVYQVSASDDGVNTIDPEFTLTVSIEPRLELFIGGGGVYDEGMIVVVDKAPSSWREYEFVGWKIDGKWSDENPPAVKMDKPHRLVAVFNKKDQATVTIDTIPRISEIQIGENIYLPDELPLTFSWPIGSEQTITVKETKNESPNTRFIFDTWKDMYDSNVRILLVEDDIDLTVLYKTQYYLKPISEFAGVEGDGWWDKGATASFKVSQNKVIDAEDPMIRYVFDGWDKGDYKNSAYNVIDLEEPSTVMAFWTREYKLDLQSNVPDVTPFGINWYGESETVALVAEEELESPSSDIKYVFDKWVSKGPNPVIIPNPFSPTTTISMDNSYIIEAEYKKSYLINVWTPFGTATGSGFYDEGATPEISIESLQVEVDPLQVRKVFSGWETGNARTLSTPSDDAGVAPNQNIMLIVDSPVNVTAKWKTQYYLDVISTQSNAKGAGWYDIGRMAPVSTNAPDTTAGLWTTYTFLGWSGDYESSNSNVRVIMNQPKTVTAEWKQDSSPGILNSILLGGVAIGGYLIYNKTRKNSSFGFNESTRKTNSGNSGSGISSVISKIKNINSGNSFSKISKLVNNGSRTKKNSKLSRILNEDDFK